ncbi:MAG TPA: asparagine synthase (glutamine-hydrolyzing) [Alphaproteobacteria bacterium]|nr:asparagine synthase (glutamine-hydrolyzing) [Alphaproteobacteria bacterium]
MCGIVAIYAYGPDAPPVSSRELRAIRERMTSRGPDGAGEWLSADGHVGLGHRRLSIIDLRAIADQPMLSVGGRSIVVFNGEIYNYRALREELAAAGCTFRTQSDTEVLLHLYERDGAEMTRKLRGMYAFAIWDANRHGLFLARDPFGVKPLYYADDGRTLRVASQVKALLAGGRVDTAPEPAGHVGFFLWGSVPDPFTLYRGVKALPAGHTMWVDAGGAAAPRRFFDPARILREAGPAPSGLAARRALIRDALVDSVVHHLVADVPVGVFLSAGLDSTTIVALACESGAGNLNTLTLGFREFEGGANDETQLAEAVARQRGTLHTTQWVLGRHFVEERDRVFDAMDQPSIDGVNTYFVAKAAAGSGLKVALSGLGGDELFGGYPSFRQVPQTARWLAPFRHLPALGRTTRRIAQPWVGRIASPKYAGLLEFGGCLAGAYLLRRSLFMPWEIARLLPRDMTTEGLAKLDTLTALARSLDGLHDDRRAVAMLEMDWYMRHTLLRDSDWAGMAHSLEIRVPLVDPVLLERLAPLLADRNPPGKQDIADAPAIQLPTEVRARRKTGFVVPVNAWIMGAAAGTRAAPDGGGLREWAKMVHAAQAPGLLVRNR